MQPNVWNEYDVAIGAYGMDPSSKPSIYEFHEVLWDRLYKGKVLFAAKCMDETGISTWYVESY